VNSIFTKILKNLPDNEAVVTQCYTIAVEFEEAAKENIQQRVVYLYRVLKQASSQLKERLEQELI